MDEDADHPALDHLNRDDDSEYPMAGLQAPDGRFLNLSLQSGDKPFDDVLWNVMDELTSSPMREAIVEMDKKRLGSTLVVDDQQILQGIITDGDLRRALKKFSNLLDKKVQEIMTPSPQTISPEALASQAAALASITEYGISFGS